MNCMNHKLICYRNLMRKTLIKVYSVQNSNTQNKCTPRGYAQEVNI